MSNVIPVIAIDGPSASGKGTVALRVAQHLGYHYLDSGAIYRLVALAALKYGIRWTDTPALVALVHRMESVFVEGRAWLDGVDVDDALRTEQIGHGASEVAIHAELRHALLDFQRNFRKPPGLVADGRDMGSVVFRDAATKVFLTASVQVRAERRYQQLIAKGKHVNISSIFQDLQARDARDSGRVAAPLVQCEHALRLETDDLSIEEAVHRVLEFRRTTAGSS